jgi:hypothetical protein
MQKVPEYVLRSAFVFDAFRLVFVPVPKAGSTALLGALAEVVGVGSDDIARSRKFEATRSLAIHDGSLWGPSFRLEPRTEEEREEILMSEDWLRVTVVREPARRLWSAWVSKVLVRDPRFVASFGESWFPAVPASAHDILDSFRAFVQGLATAPRHDDHWLPQVGLVEPSSVRYQHIGRVEHLDRTAAILASRVQESGASLPTVRRENPAILPFVPELFDRLTLAAGSDWTSSDRSAFAYEPLDPSGDEPDAAWLAAVDAAMPALHAVVDRNQRIGDLAGLLAEAPDRSRRRLPRWAARRP